MKNYVAKTGLAIMCLFLAIMFISITGQGSEMKFETKNSNTVWYKFTNSGRLNFTHIRQAMR